jgi:hypothetical protein
MVYYVYAKFTFYVMCPCRAKNEENEREWVRKIWNIWFDQVFPPTPVDSEWSEDSGDEDVSELHESPAR